MNWPFFNSRTLKNVLASHRSNNKIVQTLTNQDCSQRVGLSNVGVPGLESMGGDVRVLEHPKGQKATRQEYGLNKVDGEDLVLQCTELVPS